MSRRPSPICRRRVIRWSNGRRRGCAPKPDAVPTLYIVPTPIGNLEDITLRALRVLRECALIAAEDTRTTRVLLQHYQISTPATSYHEHNKLTKLDAIFAALESGDVALVSDAGTPGISDPGYELIQEAIRRGVRIEALPGATALIPALVASGLPTDSFVYAGFLPRKPRALRDFLAALAQETRTIVCYESPNRLLETLEALEAVFGARPLCVAREISKLHEEFFRGDISAARAHYRANPPRGEIVLLIGGYTPPPAAAWDEIAVRKALYARLDAGEPLSSAAKALAQVCGWPRRAVYELGAGRDHPPEK
ncbi:MAG: 16S rRNA (cytidine(1402)-2'-O)-methyltransferase [Chloroflexi bacterium]|nr:16S rRNA (cytidine(1402)-2'-O)-methyltransferase [Chloroflexota bacterium]